MRSRPTAFLVSLCVVVAQDQRGGSTDQGAAVNPKLVFLMEAGYREWTPEEDERLQQAMEKILQGIP